MRYPIRIYEHKGSYSALAPDVPGCIAAAKSVEKVCRLMAEALWLHLDMMRKSGESLPKPSPSLELAVDESNGEEFCTWVELKRPTMAGTKKRRSRARTPTT